MKKLAWLVTLTVFLLIAALAVYYWHWVRVTFVPREVVRRTGAREVHVVSEDHADYYWYAEVEIDQRSGRSFLAKGEWKSGLAKRAALAGKLIPDRPLDCSNCFFRIEPGDSHDREYHPYDYTLYVLSADMRNLQIYEQFG